ncbi:MAG: serine/threonine-protein kinase [Pirellulales bacterium]
MSPEAFDPDETRPAPPPPGFDTARAHAAQPHRGAGTGNRSAAASRARGDGDRAGGEAFEGDPADFGDVSRAWDVVSGQVEALVTAWDTGEEPPTLAEFLPAGSAAIQRLALIELIKVDLMYRWRRPGSERRLEQYLAEFGRLFEAEVPYDLIYEEYYVRKQVGEAVEPAEYFERFPAQAEELRRLLCLEEEPRISTALASGQRSHSVDVGERLDDFDLLTRLGKGAFATVFLARQRSMQRIVALKVSADRGNEPQTMAQLDHPHIVRVYDQRLVSDRKLRLLYMQYIPGGTLQRVVDLVRATPPRARSGKILLEAVDEALSDQGESAPAESGLRRQLTHKRWPDVVCWLGARLAGALDYAHQRGVMHRDLKPANVLVSADGSPKLADFNISFCSKIEGASPAAYFGGSLAYMSPEQLEAFNPAHSRAADELDGRADVYSLGVLLWELLTGSRPFRDESVEGGWTNTLASMIASRRSGVPPGTIAQLPPGLPQGMEDVLLKCLAPEPPERFASAGQLARQLELCLRPQVQRLMRPSSGGWPQIAARHCLGAMVVAGLVPNVTASGLNIAYNYFEIVRLLDRPGVSEQARRVFYEQLVIVNPVFYALAIGLLIRLAWPVLDSVLRIESRREPRPRRLATARSRCLKLGDYVAWVAGALWTISGIVFPVWLHASTGHVKAIYYLHFMTSQVLCGLIAATLSFFCITFLAVRAFYPSLIRGEAGELGQLDDLQGLKRRTNVYFLLAVPGPLLAIFAVLLLADTRADRIAIGILGVVAFLNFLITYRLSQLIHQDIDALMIAVSPPSDSFVAGSDTVESFWAASR